LGRFTLSTQDRAELYEEYLVNDSDLISKFSNYQLDSNDMLIYKMPVLNIDSISKNSQSIVVINNFPLVAFSQLEDSLSEYKGLTYYRASNNTTTCSADFSEYSYCNVSSFTTLWLPSFKYIKAIA